MARQNAVALRKVPTESARGSADGAQPSPFVAAWGECIDVAGYLSLICRAVDALDDELQVGAVVTAENAENIAIISSQLHHALQRVKALGVTVDGLEQQATAPEVAP